jgi:acyl-CoA synthetase (AMP-forming)/AMP-acid ligase II
MTARAGTIWELFDVARRDHSGKIAITDEHGCATYAEAHRRALGLASFLSARGHRAGDRIAILAWNGGAYFVAYFATAALGGILTPLNARLSARELCEILSDAGARWLIADVELEALVSDVARGAPSLEGVLWIGERSPGLTAESAIELATYEDAIGWPASPSLPAAVAPEAVAHLYYTSGTTGVPKGVMLTHRNVCAHARGAIEELALSERDVWAHIAPMFHLADAWATFAITQVGGRHVFLRRFDAGAALDLIEREHVTITNLVPTMLNTMVNDASARFAGGGAGSAEPARSSGAAAARTAILPGARSDRGTSPRRRDWSSLRLLLSGGAPIAPEIVRRVMSTFGCEYAQTYGMTETSPYLTLGLLKDHLKSLPLEEQFLYRCKTGRAFATIELRVVDESENDVPADGRTVGEIWVRGPTVTPGYWNRPEETRSAFHDGWLKTGDLAVIDAEGYVDIVDRKKDMIITGGEKVYSIEVENALYSHPAVLECAVFGVPDEVCGESVRAAVVLRKGSVVTEGELREHCRERMAGYKAPGSFVFLEQLPRTGSGKLRKRALRETHERG